MLFFVNLFFYFFMLSGCLLTSYFIYLIYKTGEIFSAIVEESVEYFFCFTSVTNVTYFFSRWNALLFISFCLFFMFFFPMVYSCMKNNFKEYYGYTPNIFYFYSYFFSFLFFFIFLLCRRYFALDVEGHFAFYVDQIYEMLDPFFKGIDVLPSYPGLFFFFVLLFFSLFVYFVITLLFDKKKYFNFFGHSFLFFVIFLLLAFILVFLFFFIESDFIYITSLFFFSFFICLYYFFFKPSNTSFFSFVFPFYFLSLFLYFSSFLLVLFFFFNTVSVDACTTIRYFNIKFFLFTDFSFYRMGFDSFYFYSELSLEVLHELVDERVADVLKGINAPHLLYSPAVFYLKQELISQLSQQQVDLANERIINFIEFIYQHQNIVYKSRSC
jgi:hypothetical protein